MLDTDVCIHLLNRRASYESIVERISGLSYGQVLISAITEAELAYGVARSTRKADNRGALLLFLQRFEIAPFDHDAAQRYGPLREGLKAVSQRIGPSYLLIAAHALSAGCVLVTHNVWEFSRIPDLTRQIVTRVPSSSDEWTSSLPPCSSTIRFT